MIRRRQQRGSVGTCRYHGAPMTPLTHDRYCDEVITQTGLLRDILQGADLSLTVPTCPDWTLARLVRHIGGNLRSVETAVRTGRAVEDPGRQVPDAAGPDGDDPATLDAWLADAAARFAATLRNAGPGAEAKVWAFQRSTAFWARRAANDLVIHRADAAGTVHADYTVAPELAADAIDELLELISDPHGGGPGGRVVHRARDGRLHLAPRPREGHRRAARPARRRPAGLPPPAARRQRAGRGGGRCRLAGLLAGARLPPLSPRPGRARFARPRSATGARQSASSMPLVQVSLEPGGDGPDVRLQLGDLAKPRLEAKPRAGVGHLAQPLHHDLPGGLPVGQHELGRVHHVERRAGQLTRVIGAERQTGQHRPQRPQYPRHQPHGGAHQGLHLLVRLVAVDVAAAQRLQHRLVLLGRGGQGRSPSLSGNSRGRAAPLARGTRKATPARADDLAGLLGLRGDGWLWGGGRLLDRGGLGA